MIGSNPMAWVMQVVRDTTDFVPIGGNGAAVCIFPPYRATSRPPCDRGEDQMTAPMLQACWAAAVTLALYAFYCYWEGGRADLAASFRHLVPGLPGSPRTDPAGAGYRARARWAGMGALMLALGCLSSVL
jgi:hypothetical protein